MHYQPTDLKALWDENNAQFERRCTEQEDLYNPEFESVFTALYEIDPDQREIYNTRGWDMGATLPEAVNIDTLNRALQAVGIVGDEAARFVRYAEVVLQGKKIMQANALLNLQIEMEKHQRQHTERVSPEGWKFYPIHIIAPQQFHAPICDEIERQALQGDGIFKNFTDIAERPDEGLDVLLGVEVYNVKCNFQLYLAELKKYRVTGITLGKDFTHNLFDILNEIANYIKSNTDKPEGVKAHILGIVEALDKVPIWGLIFQILILQGLISLLENCTLNQGDEGYNEAQDLCYWLADLLSDKVCRFAVTGALYGDEDWERLKPFCDFLYNTAIGQAVQNIIGNGEPNDEEHPDNPEADTLNNTLYPEADTLNDTLYLPSELDTDRARVYFTRAVEVGYMINNGTTAKWLTAVARLGYLCNKIYPQPRPIASLEKYFGVTKLSAAITQASYEAKRADVKKWRAEIDSKIFFD